MKIGIIIQARLGSTRLPRKILKQFYGGKTLLETVIANIVDSTTGTTLSGGRECEIYAPKAY